MRYTHLFALYSLFAGWTLGLEVSPNSPCSGRCLDDPKKGDASKAEDSLTHNWMLECLDSEFQGSKATNTGKKFVDCNSCLQGSAYESSKNNERDTTWFLFNNRATIDWCIFGRFDDEDSTGNISTTYTYKQCNSKCTGIYESIDHQIKDDVGSWNFCDSAGNFSEDANSCISCLHSTENLKILGNILTTLSEMCRTKPGKSIGIDANIYSPTPITLGASSSPSPTSSPATTPSNSPSNTPTDTPPASSDSGVSSGAIAGAVLGSLVGIALVLGGILYLLRRRKNRSKIIAMPVSAEAPNTNTAYSGGYIYDPVPQQQKETYAHSFQGQPYAPHEEQYAMTEQQHGPAELGSQPVVSELGPGSPGGRR